MNPLYATGAACYAVPTSDGAVFLAAAMDYGTLADTRQLYGTATPGEPSRQTAYLSLHSQHAQYGALPPEGSANLFLAGATPPHVDMTSSSTDEPYLEAALPVDYSSAMAGYGMAAPAVYGMVAGPGVETYFVPYDTSAADEGPVYAVARGT